jgi:hypothetical protein
MKCEIFKDYCRVPHLNHLKLNNKEYSNLTLILSSLDKKGVGIVNLIRDGQIISSLQEIGSNNNKKYYYNIETGEELVDYNLSHS